MKQAKSILLTILFLGAILGAFCAGQYQEALENKAARADRCRTLIAFAIRKAEGGSYSDRIVQEALKSNLYAAREFCDDPEVYGQLHDLWNSLLADSDRFLGKEDLLAEQLRNLLDVL